jgi:DNA-3-methyladenine glycosylase
LAKLKPDFYADQTLKVAKKLLGKVLYVHTKRGSREEVVAGRIVETEAYLSDDPASHSYRGETPRSKIMFGDPGVVYVYFIYGMYEMLNFITEPRGKAGGVLIRAVEPLIGEDLMRKRRGNKAATARTRHQLTSGPGKLCRAFGIEMSDNGASLQGPKFWVEDDGFKVGKIAVSPRIGITQGKDKLWRFYLDGNSFVSKGPKAS